jgi:hypothetical protein
MALLTTVNVSVEGIRSATAAVVGRMVMPAGEAAR